MTSTAVPLLGLTLLVGIGLGALLRRQIGTASSRRREKVTERRNEGCKRCGRPIDANPEKSVDWYEGMQWLCFHLEYEHDVDPDLPCGYGCPWWTIQHYERRLRELGADPAEVIRTALDEDYRDPASQPQ
jgi:hypothetical protein